jgi:hypothetical protein
MSGGGSSCIMNRHPTQIETYEKSTSKIDDEGTQAQRYQRYQSVMDFVGLQISI